MTAAHPAVLLQPCPVADRPGAAGEGTVREARRRGILTVVDGGPRPGLDAVDLNLDAISADFYGANCHKWLLAPTAPASCTWAGGGGAPATVASELGLAAGPPQTRRARRVRQHAADTLLGIRGDARRLPLAGRARRHRLSSRARFRAHPKPHPRAGPLRPLSFIRPPRPDSRNPRPPEHARPARRFPTPAGSRSSDAPTPVMGATESRCP